MSNQPHACVDTDATAATATAAVKSKPLTAGGADAISPLARFGALRLRNETRDEWTRFMVMLRAWVWADSKMIVWLCMCCAGYLGEQNDEQMTTGWQMFVASSASNQRMSPGPDQQMAEGGSPVLLQ